MTKQFVQEQKNSSMKLQTSTQRVTVYELLYEELWYMNYYLNQALWQE